MSDQQKPRRRSIVLLLLAGHKHEILIDPEKEKEIEEYFAVLMAGVRDDKAERMHQWAGLTFVPQWLIGFYFKDYCQEDHRRESIALQKEYIALIRKGMVDDKNDEWWKGGDAE